MVKIRMDGPMSGRWVNLARYWWEQHHGPVPEGKRVCHMDGDTLNDDPSNYGLMTPGDVLFMCGEWDPKMRARNERARRKATIQHNKDRSLIYRALNWLAESWYPVDVDRRQIINDPYRERWQLFTAYGLESGPDPNGRGTLSAMLGWPGQPLMAASMLAVLLQHGPQSSAFVLREANALRNRYGFSPLKAESLRSAAWLLRERGLIETHRRRVHQLTAAAAAIGQPPFTFIACQGRELDQRFAGFERAERQAIAG